jgi:hypothetical protein
MASRHAPPTPATDPLRAALLKAAAQCEDNLVRGWLAALAELGESAVLGPPDRAAADKQHRSKG